MLSGRTIATITVAACRLYPPEALPGGVYARDGEKLAETFEERASAISDSSQPRYRSHARCPRTASETSSSARRMCRTYSCRMTMMNTEAEANVALAVVAPGRPHRGAAQSGTVAPATDPGPGATVFLCLTDEIGVLASSTIGCG